jgi:hypothetical protein
VLLPVPAYSVRYCELSDGFCARIRVIHWDGMLRFSLLGSRAPAAHRAATALGALLGALVVTSCLTPSIDFGDPPETRTGGAPGTGGMAGPGTGGGSSSGGASLGGFGGDGDPPVPHCTNRTLDSDETDKDCGGLDCPKCGNGKICEIDNDCVIDSCVMAECQAPSCIDDVENALETDVDCGGPKCGACRDGDSCIEPTDCDSEVCKSGKCAAPTCEDKVQNDQESDIDCGGDCDPCDAGSGCDVDDDCEQPPDLESFATCEDGVCTITCGNPLMGDCNSNASDSCETNLLTAIAHCGACGDTCAPDNAVGQCVAGNCLIDTSAPDTVEGCLGTFANCNGETEDGCEADLMNDAETCSSCDFACSAAGGTADCDAGSCIIDCDPGFDDCNEDVSDGCEVDLTVSTLHCTECFNACTAVPPEVPVCDGTECLGITCNDVADCGGVQPCGACDPDTQCDDLLTTTTHCGGCGIDCTAANAITACEDSGGYSCAIAACSGAYADCDEQYLNGCEIETDTNRNRCGDCLASDAAGGSGEDCDVTMGPQVAQTSCTGGACKVLSCNSGYADCNGTWADGCEANLNTNDTHCGGCTTGPTTTWDGGANCDATFANASGICSAGVCEFSACSGNYEDCNSNVSSDGCETLAQGDPDNCGGCGNLSSQYECATNGNTTSNTCTGSATTCTPTCFNNSGTTGADYGNCDSEPWDGCETALQTSTSNCGACGNNCTTSMHASGASASCAAASCAIATCDPNLADCNGTWSDGCEVNTSNTTTNCGGCTSGPTTTWDGGANCTTSMHSTGASAQCSTSACSILTCDANLADCNGTWGDGCEINTTTAAAHCGGCTTGPTTAWDGGTDCSGTMHSTGASAVCVSGTSCAIATCDAGLADCNGTFSDGCEINTTSNVTHCGGCQSGPTTAWDGGETCVAKPNTTVSGCTSSVCTYACTAGWSNTNGSWTDGCEARTITLVNSSNPGDTATYFESISGTGTLAFSHTLQTALGNQRLVLVGYLCRGNNTTDCTPTVTYGSTPMLQLGTTVGGSTQYAGIFYLLDAALPGAGAYTVTLDPPNDSGYAAQILELAGVEQDTFYAAFGNNANNNNCTNTAGNDVSVSLASLPTGSRIYALAGGYTNATVTITPQSPLSLLNSAGTLVSGVQLGFGGAWTNSTVSGTQSAPFQLSGCDRSVMFAVGLRPEANY